MTRSSDLERRATLLIWVGWIGLGLYSALIVLQLYTGHTFYAAVNLVIVLLLVLSLRQNYISRRRCRDSGPKAT